MLTIRDLVRAPDLEVRVVAGHAGDGREVRWAHVTELADPVPWLRGGELVLTVGLGIGEGGAEEQRRYVRRLHAAGCAGLGFALDTWIREIPAAVPDAADELGLPLLLVEGTTPFIAVVEAVAGHYAEERVRAQQRVLAAQDAMARGALRAGVGGVLREVAAATGGEAVLLDPNGVAREASGPGEHPWHTAVRSEPARGGSRPRGMALVADGEATILVQSLSMSGSPLGRLAVRCPSPVSTHTRMLVNHAASLLAVDRQRTRSARLGRQRERGRSLALLLDDDVAPRLRPHAAGLLPLPTPPFEVAVYPTSDPSTLLDAAADTVPDVLGETEAAERVAMCPLPGALAVVLPDRGTARPRPGAGVAGDATTGRAPDARPRLGERVLAHLRGAPADADRAGACTARGVAELPEAARRARRAAAAGPGYHHVDDTDAWSLLRRSLDPGTREEFVTRLLGRLREHDERNGTALVAALRTYLDHDGNLEAAARDLGVHRNTMRTRIRTAERVTGRPFTPAHRHELWVALALADTTG